MKNIILTALKTGMTRTKKSLAEFTAYLYPLSYLFTTNDLGWIVCNKNPFWSEENNYKRIALINDIKAIHRKNMKDSAYFHILNRFENGDGYGIVKAYYGTLEIKQADLERYRTLLEINDLSDLDDEKLEELGAKENDNIFLGKISFSDNRYIMLYLCSGLTNYYVYDELHYKDENGYSDYNSYFELSEGMEFTYNCNGVRGIKYIVDIVVPSVTEKTSA